LLPRSACNRLNNLQQTVYQFGEPLKSIEMHNLVARTDVNRFTKMIAVALAFTALSACSLPRGAALQSEVIKEKGAETATFQVVDVTRVNADLIFPRSAKVKFPTTAVSAISRFQ
jgi:hypothetical protein